MSPFLQTTDTQPAHVPSVRYPEQDENHHKAQHEAHAEHPACQEFQTAEQKTEEARRIRRLQLIVNLVILAIQQDPNLPVEHASEMVAEARRTALGMFPGKALAFDLLCWPRLQRTVRQRYRMQ